jgi:hypothetical protein
MDQATRRSGWEHHLSTITILRNIVKFSPLRCNFPANPGGSKSIVSNEAGSRLIRGAI